MIVLNCTIYKLKDYHIYGHSTALNLQNTEVAVSMMNVAKKFAAKVISEGFWLGRELQTYFLSRDCDTENFKEQ